MKIEENDQLRKENARLRDVLQVGASVIDDLLASQRDAFAEAERWLSSLVDLPAIAPYRNEIAVTDRTHTEVTYKGRRWRVEVDSTIASVDVLEARGWTRVTQGWWERERGRLDVPGIDHALRATLEVALCDVLGMEVGRGTVEA